MKHIMPYLLLLALFLPVSAHAVDIEGGEGHYYHIVWYKDATSYITESAGGLLQVEAPSKTARQYWQFIPTGNPNCYYIRNAVTGHYIDACSATQDNTRNIGTVSKPVEYYVVSESQLDGAFRLTSTNCANYDNTSKGPVGLNKNGANSSIITWAAGYTNPGSYWCIQATEYDYDAEGALALTQHSEYAKATQVYFMPCGSHFSTYLVRKLRLDGEVLKPLDYPCTTWGGSTKKTGTATTNTWWTLYTTDKAMVKAGAQFAVDITLGKALPEGYLAQLCFDWDRDGVFEDVKTIDNPLSKTLSYNVTVPVDAREGQSRMRFRLTDNALDNPDGEVTAGQILDCLIETLSSDCAINDNEVHVSVNDPKRGYVETSSVTDGDTEHVTVTARPYGNARFLCWLEGRKVVGTLGNYQFDLVRPIHLVAVFSVNTYTDDNEGIHSITIGDDDTPYKEPLYYDLTGRLVTTPVSGETYIRKDSSQKGRVVVY